MNLTMQPDRSAIFRGVFAVGTILVSVWMYRTYPKTALRSNKQQVREYLGPARETIQRVKKLEQERRRLAGNSMVCTATILKAQRWFGFPKGRRSTSISLASR
jgi:hypothetical protein